MEDKEIVQQEKVYYPQDDRSIPSTTDTRKVVLTLKKIHELKLMRAQSRREQVKNSAIVPYLYNPSEEEQGI